MRKAFLLLLLLLAAAPLQAATFYTATTGNNSNPGTEAQPFLTIGKGVSVLTPGDTLYIKAGTYAEFINNTIPGGTSWAAPVRVAAYPGDTVTMRPAPGASDFGIILDGSAKKYIILEGFILDGVNVGYIGVKLARPTVGTNTANHIRLLNMEIKNVPEGAIVTNGNSDFNEFIGLNMHNNGKRLALQPSGVYLYNYAFYLQGSDNVIENCNIYDQGASGIQIYNGNAGESANNTIIRNNNIHENTVLSGPNQNRGGGVVIASGSGHKIYNNLVWNNYHGIFVANSSNNLVANNSIYGNPNTGIEIGAGSGNLFQNNIVYQNGGQIANGGGAGASFTANLCNSVTPQCSRSTSVSPFVSATSDFHLATGGQAIGNGINLSTSGGFTTDYAGTTRQSSPTAWDIGAYRASVGVDSLTLLSPSGAGISVAKNSAYTVTWSSTGTPGNVTIKYGTSSATCSSSTYSTTLVSGTTNDESESVTIPNAAAANACMQICNAGATLCDVSDNSFTVTDSAGGSLTKIISANTTGTYTGTILGVSDGPIIQQTPTVNNGVSGTNVQYLFTTKYDVNDHAHSLLKFDGVSQIPTTATLTSVTLGLYQEQGGGGGSYTIDIRRLLRTWVEPQATWNIWSTGNNWTTAGGLGAATDRTSTAAAQIGPIAATTPSPPITPGWHSVTQTSGGLFDLVQGWISGSITNQGVHLERNGTGQDFIYSYLTSSNGTDGHRPYLSLTYSTVTGTITLTSPTTGGHLFPGDLVPIRWQSSGISGNVQILMSRDGGNDWDDLTLAQGYTTGYPFDSPDFIWTVTNGKATSNAFFKVISVSQPTVLSVSPPVRIGGKYRH